MPEQTNGNGKLVVRCASVWQPAKEGPELTDVVEVHSPGNVDSYYLRDLQSENKLTYCLLFGRYPEVARQHLDAIPTPQMTVENPELKRRILGALDSRDSQDRISEVLAEVVLLAEQRGLKPAEPISAYQ